MAFPPLRTRPAEPVTAAVALETLQAFLEAAASSAHLAPNATLQPGGPTSQGRLGASLTMHNLKRVEAGLRGEWLAPRLDLDRSETGVAATDGLDTDAEREKEGWVDLETYRRERSVEDDDMSMTEDIPEDKKAKKREKKAWRDKKVNKHKTKE